MTLPMLCSLLVIDTVLEFLSRNSSSSSSKPFTTFLQFNDLTNSVTPYNLLYEDQVYSTEIDILDGLTSFSLPILFLTLFPSSDTHLRFFHLYIFISSISLSFKYSLALLITTLNLFIQIKSFPSPPGGGNREVIIFLSSLFHFFPPNQGPPSEGCHYHPHHVSWYLHRHMTLKFTDHFLITHSFNLHNTVKSLKKVSSHLYAAEKTRGQKLSELPTFLYLARAGTGTRTKVSIPLLLRVFHYFKQFIGLCSHHDIYFDIYWHLRCCTVNVA